MLFKCLALEKPSYRVLNYDPGIVYTDGAKLVYEENLFGEKFKRKFKSLLIVLINNKYQHHLQKTMKMVSLLVVR